jgi:hypothetical protein
MKKINIDILRRLIKLIDIKKADDYNEWMIILWCLKTIQKEYNLNKKEVYEIFKDFSKLSNKYEEKECEKVFYKEYNVNKKKIYTLGTLLYYAEINNEEETKKIKREIWDDYKLKIRENLLNDKYIYNLTKKINDKKKYIEELDLIDFNDFDDFDDNDFYNLKIIFSIKDLIVDYLLKIYNIIYYNDNLYLFNKGKWFEINDNDFYKLLNNNYNFFNFYDNDKLNEVKTNNKSILIKILGNFNTQELILNKIKSLNNVDNINNNNLIINSYHKYINDLNDFNDIIINYYCFFLSLLN